MRPQAPELVLDEPFFEWEEVTGIHKRADLFAMGVIACAGCRARPAHYDCAGLCEACDQEQPDEA